MHEEPPVEEFKRLSVITLTLISIFGALGVGIFIEVLINPPAEGAGLAGLNYTFMALSAWIITLSIFGILAISISGLMKAKGWYKQKKETIYKNEFIRSCIALGLSIISLLFGIGAIIVLYI